MYIQEMSLDACREMLTGRRVARLACASNNQPYIVPIHVDLDGEFLYSFATMGQKIEWMRENPLVCLEIDELTSQGTWVSVVVFGNYEELPNTPEYEDPRRIAESLFQRHPMWWEPASVPIVAQPQRPPIVFRIEIDRMTGRIAGPDKETTAEPPGASEETTRQQGLAQMLRRLFAGR